jgi:CDP-4-dehydro-6-deoxyglucose reductase
MIARLIGATQIAPAVRNFVFEAEGVPRLEFAPGQWVSFTEDVNGQAITRAYSIASAPDGTNRFELCLNLVENGHLSPRLFQMKPGETISMQAPLGTFVLRYPNREALFVATGTGIAPFRAILQAHLNEASPAITLLFGVRYEAGLLYRAEFEAMAARFPKFRFWPTLTRPGPDWRGRTGRVQTHLDEAALHQGQPRDLDVYLCGLKEMVDSVRNTLKGMGFGRKQIFYEKYD